jgi:two-component system chemotaxis response regulator CheB
LQVDGLGRLLPVRSQGGHCPSGNKLLASLARAHGRRAGGVVLTGMGEDGALGLLDIRNAGGLTLAQDAQTCVVFGMPLAAFELGATQSLMPTAVMAAVIRQHCIDRGQQDRKAAP